MKSISWHLHLLLLFRAFTLSVDVKELREIRMAWIVLKQKKRILNCTWMHRTRQNDSNELQCLYCTYGSNWNAITGAYIVCACVRPRHLVQKSSSGKDKDHLIHKSIVNAVCKTKQKQIERMQWLCRYVIVFGSKNPINSLSMRVSACVGVSIFVHALPVCCNRIKLNSTKTKTKRSKYWQQTCINEWNRHGIIVPSQIHKSKCIGYWLFN